MPRLKFVSTVQGADRIELQDPIITIGRGVDNVVCIEDANISKHHVLLIKDEGTYKIFDLYSVNGTTVNGKRITVTTLCEGDAVRLGYLELTYEIAAPAHSPVPATPPPPATANEEPHVKIQTPTEKSSTPASSAVPPVPSPTTILSGFRAKPTLRSEPAVVPSPPIPATAEETPSEIPPAPLVSGPRKLGAAPGEKNLKFRLKRE